MTHQYATVERDGPLTLITLNRPEALNALHYDANLELQAIFDAYEADDEQWVAIVTGAGSKAFCAGMDLKWQAAGGALATPPKGFGGLTARPSMSKPVIAAVNGVAFGGGFEIALASDIVVAAPHAMFGLTEVRVGLAALGGGLQRLPREIGLKRAMGILLTGRRVGAEEALALGLVNEVADNALAAARRWAADILACGPLAVRATKASVLGSLPLATADAMREQWSWPDMVRMLGSDDAVEGPRAFAEKRPPRWRGR